jgi:hypothetical protein
MYPEEVVTFLTHILVTELGENRPRVEVLFTDGGAIAEYPFVFLVYRHGQVFSLVGQPSTNQIRAAFHAELNNVANGLVARMVEAAAAQAAPPVPAAEVVSAA